MKARRPEVGDCLALNGRLALVFHVDRERHRALVRVEGDPQAYSVTEALAQTLIQAFESDPRYEEVTA